MEARLLHWESSAVADDEVTLPDNSEISVDDCRVATRKVAHALEWLRTFFTGASGTLHREYFACQWWSEPELLITTDASPWGLGATLHHRDHLVAVLSDPLTEDDCSRFKFKIGDAAGQATWEALAELVATRTWQDRWYGLPWNIAMRGDSKAALGALGKLRSVRSPAINAIAREMSLDLAGSPHKISVREHLPGKLNILADFLSRRHQPGAAVLPPWDLGDVEWSPVQQRDDGWWKTWKRSSASSSGEQ